MELRQLRYFVTAAELGSISKAAEICCVAQPSVSQQISLLEQDLGVRLLERNSRGVRVTAEGERVLDKARDILGDCEGLKLELSVKDEMRGVLRLGVIPTIAPYMVADLLKVLRGRFPLLSVELVEDETRVLVEMLGKDQISCAVVSDIQLKDKRMWSIQMEEIFYEPLVLALPENHRLATRRQRPKVKEVKEDELIYLKQGHCLLDQTLKACGVKQPGQKLKCDQLETALEMVSAGGGIAVVPALATRRMKPEGVVIRRFAEPQPTRLVGLMWKQGGTVMANAIDVLPDVLRQCGLVEEDDQ